MTTQTPIKVKTYGVTLVELTPSERRNRVSVSDHVHQTPSRLEGKPAAKSWGGGTIQTYTLLSTYTGALSHRARLTRVAVVVIAAVGRPRGQCLKDGAGDRHRRVAVNCVRRSGAYVRPIPDDAIDVINRHPATHRGGKVAAVEPPAIIFLKNKLKRVTE